MQKTKSQLNIHLSSELLAEVRARFKGKISQMVEEFLRISLGEEPTTKDDCEKALIRLQQRAAMIATELAELRQEHKKTLAENEKLKQKIAELKQDSKLITVAKGETHGF